MTYRVILFIICACALITVFTHDAHANATNIVSPNGGNCLTVGEAFTIEFSWSGSNVEHVALYYRTDGQQPTHLDSSRIKHPINVPQQGTTWSWTPGTSHISETGRIWIDGHDNGHISLNTWDSSDANFAVRSSCTGAGIVAPPPPSEAVSGKSVRLTPQPPRGFTTPAKVVDVIPSAASARIQFEIPWEDGTYRVRLLEEKNDGLFIVKHEEKDMRVHRGKIIEFLIDGLEQNAEYDLRYYIQAYDFAFGFESARSEIIPAFWTLLEAPKAMRAVEISPTHAILELTSKVPNLSNGISHVWFENITTSASSSWIGKEMWKAEDLKADTQYQFWAKARNGIGVETPFGALLTLKTPPLPVLPEEKGPSKEEVAEEKEREQIEHLKKILEPIAETLQLYMMRNQVREIARAVDAVFEARRREEEVRRASAEKKEKPHSFIEKPILPIPPVFSRAPATFYVRFEDGRFSPEIIEIQPGDKVRWTNYSDSSVWPASDPHPTHTGSIGFDAYGDLLRSEFYEYTFKKSGTWPYHDHSRARMGVRAATGAVIVRMPEQEILPEVKEETFEKALELQKEAPLRAIPPETKKFPVQEIVPVPSLLPLLPETQKILEISPREKEIRATTTISLPPRLPQTFVVLIDETGFNPKLLEIKAGDAVRWINTINKPFWPASDPHPTHTGLPGFDALGDIFQGESFQHTFREPGVRPYHNHTQANAEIDPEIGTIIIGL